MIELIYVPNQTQESTVSVKWMIYVKLLTVVFSTTVAFDGCAI